MKSLYYLTGWQNGNKNQRLLARMWSTYREYKQMGTLWKIVFPE